MGIDYGESLIAYMEHERAPTANSDVLQRIYAQQLAVALLHTRPEDIAPIDVDRIKQVRSRHPDVFEAPEPTVYLEEHPAAA